MEKDCWQLIGFVLVGIIPWFAGYAIQRSGGHRSVVFHPPRFVVWLCGNPRGDGQIDLGEGGMQLTALVPLIGGPLTIFLGIEFRLRLAIVITTYLLTVIAWLGVMGWVSWQQQKRNNALDV